ncbi:MAG: hypothetical protein KZQ64_05500 [gamma proteobacterium symbiont of Bathyaustriella thionipta]|nr:hypothetical protein [gamma proteobacterium symbiont of Bathyaustriella thionipta]MCU7951306.1 hypothetical protein [gamma proteobacterium symbiont of Bathyaustriella thionipta]MCU7952834.1 hypothetical protein [gamma proteobacterium symbiont of Bathyaustriella thionipta]MCU7957854.1 hypothetical protein [gamma proteobacterium symbiont of Bathyaustriella thionipta]MCU7967337.1 hypothetical protein [gamma proteobacterium symbiont of Bathyaustriella thionipta]
MNTVDSSSNTYPGMLQQAARRKTVTQVVDAKQSGSPVNVEQVQLSNQQLRVDARELGVERV